MKKLYLMKVNIVIIIRRNITFHLNLKNVKYTLKQGTLSLKENFNDRSIEHVFNAVQVDRENERIHRVACQYN